MKVAYSFFGEHHEKLKYYAEQLGIRHSVVTLPAASAYSGYVRPWDYPVLAQLKKEMGNHGMSLDVIEGIDFIDSAKLGLPDRDQAIGHFCQLIENMGKLGIRTVCYNWMPIFGWFRSNTSIRGRGSAIVTGFSYDDVKDWPETSFGHLGRQQLWDNLEYFLKKVVPVAERCQVELAIHPDDPPVDEIAGIERILTSSDAMHHVTELVPSHYNGITLCQGTFATMGEDIPRAIRRFGGEEKLFFAHFRDIRGSRNDFTETFHDEGKTDMYEALRCYYEVGYQGVMRPDHVPSMYDEDNAVPSYGILGNLFAAGYMMGLMEAIEKKER